MRNLKALLVGLALGSLVAVGYAQVSNQPTTPVSISIQYPLTAISATAAVNNQVTLTIPAPPAGFYNYVCSIHYRFVDDGTATVQTLAVTTSTNFNGYAFKYSSAATANTFTEWVDNWGVPASAGCPKSTSPGTATTFVGPAAAANGAQVWTATYYQAP